MRKTDVPLKVLPTEAYFDLIRELLLSCGEARVRVTGSSMLPLLRHLKDCVILEPIHSINVGDIVLFDRRNGRYALHRVIKKGTDTFTMAGDNQWHMEKDLPMDQIVGVVTAIERNGRRIDSSSPVLRLYSQVVSLAAFPRINIRKVLRRLLRPLRTDRKPDDTQKGVRQ